MSKKKLPKLEKKVKLSITISNDLNQKLIALTNNKSKFIEALLVAELSNNKYD